METAVSNGETLTPSRNSLDDPVYERIKRGELDYLEHYSRELNSLLWLMVHPDPAARPTAAKLLANPLLNPTITKSRYRRVTTGLKPGLWIRIHFLRSLDFGQIWLRIQGYVINFEKNVFKRLRRKTFPFEKILIKHHENNGTGRHFKLVASLNSDFSLTVHLLPRIYCIK